MGPAGSGLIGSRLKQLRLSLGLSLEELASRISNAVTKQALSKYEKGSITPLPSVLLRLGKALGVRSSYLISSQQVTVSILGLRKKCTARKKEVVRVINLMSHELEKRASLESLFESSEYSKPPILQFKISHINEAEDVAEQLRKTWKLGIDPIKDLIYTLETNHVHVLVIHTSDKFDGMSAYANISRSKKYIAAVLTRDGISGERQRLNVSHELGHLVMKIDDSIDAEKAAYRFAGAFLAPRKALELIIGTKRRNIATEELLHLKRTFGMSVQALVIRLRDLEIITESDYKSRFIYFGKIGWRKDEPTFIDPEKPMWIKQVTLRAFQEGILSRQQVEYYGGDNPPFSGQRSANSPTSLMKLSIEERRRIMAEGAIREAVGK